MYDALSYFNTQLAFSFAVAPFVLLDLKSCMIVWGRVHFYCIIGVALSMGLFASPGKPWLIKTLDARNGVVAGKDGRPAVMVRSASNDSLAHVPGSETVLGLPSDPGKTFDEAVQEVRDEVESMRRRGSRVTEKEVEQVKQAKGL